MKCTHTPSSANTSTWCATTARGRRTTTWSIIQNEYCNGGSLQDQLEELRRNSDSTTSNNNNSNSSIAKGLAEPELRRLLQHVAEGLRYVYTHI